MIFFSGGSGVFIEVNSGGGGWNLFSFSKQFSTDLSFASYSKEYQEYVNL